MLGVFVPEPSLLIVDGPRASSIVVNPLDSEAQGLVALANGIVLFNADGTPYQSPVIFEPLGPMPTPPPAPAIASNFAPLTQPSPLTASNGGGGGTISLSDAVLGEILEGMADETADAAPPLEVRELVETTQS